MVISTTNSDAYDIAVFVLDKMNIDLNVDCTIYIDIRHKDAYHGYVENLNGDYFVTISKKLKSEMFIRTVMHEMIHVAQFISGRLKFENRRRLWLGNDHSNDEYNDQPWELEAYELEEKFYQEYINANSN